MRLDLLRAMNAERAARRAAVLVTDLDNGEERLILASSIGDDPLAEIAEPALRAGKSGTFDFDACRYFLTVQVPPVRLVAIGAVHITQALAPLAKVVGFDVTIIDPRTAFATPERFPDVRLIAEWPETALAGLTLDRYSALAAFTHDPKIDDQALSAALKAECFYIGALGSRKSHAGRLARLGRLGFGQEELQRIRAPIGLDIGAVSPSEIAVSVLGEIVDALRKKPHRNAVAAPAPGSAEKVA